MTRFKSLRTMLVALACAVPLAALAEEAPPQAEEPLFAVPGFVKPKERDRGCVRRAIHVPDDLEGKAKRLAVRWAVERDGTPTRFEVLTEGADQRAADAVWQAVKSCEIIPGRNAEGVPVALWVFAYFDFGRDGPP